MVWVLPRPSAACQFSSNCSWEQYLGSLGRRLEVLLIRNPFCACEYSGPSFGRIAFCDPCKHGGGNPLGHAPHEGVAFSTSADGEHAVLPLAFAATLFDGYLAHGLGLPLLLRHHDAGRTPRPHADHKCACQFWLIARLVLSICHATNPRRLSSYMREPPSR